MGSQKKATSSSHLLIPWSTPQASRRAACQGDLAEMEGAASVQSPSHDGQAVCHRQDGRISPKEGQSLKEKGGDRHSSERRREKGSLETREGSRSKAGQIPVNSFFAALLWRAGWEGLGDGRDWAGGVGGQGGYVTGARWDLHTTQYVEGNPRAGPSSLWSWALPAVPSPGLDLREGSPGPACQAAQEPP